METVILVHGIGLWGLELFLLKYRLQKQGFKCKLFHYSMWRKSLPNNATALQNFINLVQSTKIHLVGHSLGGLLINQLFLNYPQPFSGRIVTLGTPYHGSQVARQLSRYRWGKWLLGNCVTTAFANIPPLPPTEIGIIAGKLDIGTGWLLGLRKPNDSLIAVDEVICPNATENLILPVSHSALLMSTAVCQQICHFLKTGYFLAIETQQKSHGV